MTGRILVADDDFDNRTIIQDALCASGYEVLIAVNGEEAFGMAMQTKPDLILLDMSMPKISGWEVAKRLRADERFQKTPILAFTAHALAGESKKALSAGCDDYIAKPCQPKDLLERIQFWMDQRSIPSSKRDA